MRMLPATTLLDAPPVKIAKAGDAVVGADMAVLDAAMVLAVDRVMLLYAVLGITGMSVAVLMMVLVLVLVVVLFMVSLAVALAVLLIALIVLLMAALVPVVVNVPPEVCAALIMVEV